LTNRNVIIGLVLLLAVAWWFLHEDAEAEVREAHQELSRLLSKTEGEEEAAETREVVSRLQKVEGKWLFSEFTLAKVLEN